MQKIKLLTFVILMSSSFSVFAQFNSGIRSHNRRRFGDAQIILDYLKFEVDLEEGQTLWFDYGDDGMPYFEGGAGCFEDYILECVTYPILALENGVEGRVICSVEFSRQEDNLKIEKVETIRGLARCVDEECKRLLLDCPKWKVPNNDKYSISQMKMYVGIMFKLKD